VSEQAVNNRSDLAALNGDRCGSFAANSAETACPQMSALHQYRP
jgi:hypothetical protein